MATHKTETHTQFLIFHPFFYQWNNGSFQLYDLRELDLSNQNGSNQVQHLTLRECVYISVKELNHVRIHSLFNQPIFYCQKVYYQTFRKKLPKYRKNVTSGLIRTIYNHYNTSSYKILKEIIKISYYINSVKIYYFTRYQVK